MSWAFVKRMDTPVFVQFIFVFRSARWHVKAVVEHLYFRLFTVLLIIVDITLVIIDITIAFNDKKTSDAITIVSRVIVSYFLLEISLRIFAKG